MNDFTIEYFSDSSHKHSWLLLLRKCCLKKPLFETFSIQSNNKGCMHQDSFSNSILFCRYFLSYFDSCSPNEVSQVGELSVAKRLQQAVLR